MRMKKVYLAVIVIALILCVEGVFSLAEGDWGKGLGRCELRTSPVSASDRRLFFPAVQAGKVSWPR